MYNLPLPCNIRISRPDDYSVENLNHLMIVILTVSNLSIIFDIL